jgi:hypothetical protein
MVPHSSSPFQTMLYQDNIFSRLLRRSGIHSTLEASQTLHLYSPMLNSLSHSTTSAWWRHRSMTQATSALYPHSREQKTKFVLRLQHQSAIRDVSPADKTRSFPSWSFQHWSIWVFGHKALTWRRTQGKWSQHVSEFWLFEFLFI